MQTIFRNPLYEFIRSEEHNVLIFDWSSDTQNMTLEDFKEALSNFAGYVSSYHGTGLLVDTTKFKFNPGPEGGQYRNEDYLPRFLEGGATKLAYVVPTDARQNLPESEVITNGFKDNFFTGRTPAFKWLAT